MTNTVTQQYTYTSTATETSTLTDYETVTETMTQVEPTTYTSVYVSTSVVDNVIIPCFFLVPFGLFNPTLDGNRPEHIYSNDHRFRDIPPDNDVSLHCDRDCYSH